MQTHMHGMVLTVSGLTMTVLTYAQVFVSITAGLATIAAAIYTMWPVIGPWLKRRRWLK